MEKVVLITGGSSGIGKAVGEYLLSKGYKVYGTSRNPSQNSTESSFKLLKMDVTQGDTIAAAVQHIIAAEDRLDVLINNAGVGITGPIEELSLIHI